MASSVPNYSAPKTGARRRAWIAFGAFALGLVLARLLADGLALGPGEGATSALAQTILRPSPWFAIAGLSAAAAFASRWSALTKSALIVGMLTLGTGWWMLRLENARPDLVWNHLRAEALDRQPPGTATGDTLDARGVLTRLEVILLENPSRPADPDPAMTPAFLGPAAPRADARIVGGTGPTMDAARGLRVRVLLPEHEPGAALPRAGDRIAGLGWLRAPRAPLNPGEPDARRWAAQSGDLGLFVLGDAANTIDTTGTRGTLTLAQRAERGWLRARATLRERALRAVGADDTEAGRLLRAVLLGERDPRLDDTRDAFARVGIAHLLAISGLHVGLFALVVLRALRATGDHGQLETVLVLALVALLLVLVPANPPVVRAGVLTMTLVAASAIGRRYDPLTLLAWVAIGLLVWRPMDATGLGFQLSVGITALLLFMGAGGAQSAERMLADAIAATPTHPAPARFGPRLRWSRLRSFSWMCAVCWLASVPLIASHTGVVSPLAWLVTIVVTPLFTLLVTLGYAVMLVGLAVPPIAETLGPITEALGRGLVDAVRLADRAPVASISLAPLPAWIGVVGSVLVGAWMTPALRDDRVGRAALAIATAAAILAGGFIGATAGRVPEDTVRIDMLAVGDGSCYLVRNGRETILWDAGSLRPGVGRRTVPRALHALGVGRIDAAFVTHANLDHFNGLSDLFVSFRVRRLYTSEAVLGVARARHSSPEAELLRRAERAGVEIVVVQRGDTLALGRARVDVLWPPGDGSFSPERGIGLNDTSLVARVVLGDATLLLTGDIQSAAIAGLLAAEPDLSATVIELPHHGSARPEAFAFVHAVDPEVVLQSTGPSRAGDPRWATTRAGRRWITTATDGAGWAILHEQAQEHGAVRAGSLRRGEIAERE